MARKNASAQGLSLGKFRKGAGETEVCALHKLPIEERKGKRRVRLAGKVQDVDATYYVCPAGCCDPHVEGSGDKTVPVVGLSAWKRAMKIEPAKENLAEFKRDKDAYIKKMVPERKPLKTWRKPGTIPGPKVEK